MPKGSTPTRSSSISSRLTLRPQHTSRPWTRGCATISYRKEPSMPDLTDAQMLRVLAEWLDLEDAKVGRIGNEIQLDLRRIASIIESPLHEAAGVMLAALKRLD